MVVWNLEGNEAAAERLREAASRRTLPHALLFTGSGDRMELARFTAAAFACTAEGGRPCGKCQGCRKVLQGIHPDLTVVQDAEHKNVAIDVVRSICADAWVRPNEGERKIYLFPDCALLTEADQNVLLKVVEEGPPYAVFLFCGENPAQMLPTLRSRCVELKLRPAQAEEQAASENTMALCRALGAKKAAAVTQTLVGMERAKCSREELQALLEESCGVLTAALLTEYGQQPAGQTEEMALFLAKNLTKKQIMGKIELLQKYRQQCLYNVSASQTLGALAVELEGIL